MDVTIYLAGFGGFMIGMFVWSRVLRWAAAIWTVLKERQRDPVHRSRWRLVAVALLNSGPWTLAALIVMAVLILPSAHAEGWNWLFYGVIASALFQGFIIVWFTRKIHKRRFGSASAK